MHQMLMSYIPNSFLTFKKFLLELYLKQHLPDFPLPFNRIVIAFLKTVNKCILYMNRVSPQS